MVEEKGPTAARRVSCDRNKSTAAVVAYEYRGMSW
jgi:hypothetical protein